ncbi:hypothetical protein [Mycolicibacterium phocaicum]|uniref:hypothetical protein n=1 Tax=Mycolicibacterium phocaicum TaxID=319706 RepID=UPI001F30C36A|nr:hypothetical protein [Mycolicibacterium phocaicum]
MGSGSATDQLAFDLDEALLRDTTFVVVDLETTGGRARADDTGGGWTPSPRSVRSRCAAARSSANWPP